MHIFEINKKLSKRINKGVPYPITIGLFSILIAMFTMLINNEILNNSILSKKSSFIALITVLMCLVFLFSVLPLIIKIDHKMFYSTKPLNIFPISARKIYHLQIISILMDFRLVLYCSSFILSTIFFFLGVSYKVGVISGLIFILTSMTYETLISNLSILLINFPKFSVRNLLFIPIFSPILIKLLKLKEDFFIHIPLFSWPGWAIYHFHHGDYLNSFLYVFFLILLSVAVYISGYYLTQHLARD